MKSIFALALLFFIVINLGVAGTTAMAQAPRPPEAAARSFYEWYLHALNRNEDPLGRHRAELSQFVTRRLLQALNRALKRPGGIDADFFLDAQDWDEAWEKNVSVSKAKIEGARAAVTVLLKGNSLGDHKLRVGLVQEGGGWKIDSVNGRANP